MSFSGNFSENDVVVCLLLYISAEGWIRVCKVRFASTSENAESCIWYSRKMNIKVV